jgi:hypothetical protein
MGEVPPFALIDMQPVRYKSVNFGAEESMAS